MAQGTSVSETADKSPTNVHKGSGFVVEKAK